MLKNISRQKAILRFYCLGNIIYFYAGANIIFMCSACSVQKDGNLLQEMKTEVINE